jgi:hypothetical protein
MLFGPHPSSNSGAVRPMVATRSHMFENVKWPARSMPTRYAGGGLVGGSSLDHHGHRHIGKPRAAGSVDSHDRSPEHRGMTFALSGTQPHARKPGKSRHRLGRSYDRSITEASWQPIR